MPNYREYPSWLVDRQERNVVAQASRLCVEDLKLPSSVTTHWFLRDDDAGDIYFDGDVAGLSDPSGHHIYLRPWLDVTFLARVVPHEFRHSWQKQNGRTLSKASAERDAQIYELQFIQRLGWPSSETALIRALADAYDERRKTDQARLDALRDTLRSQEQLHANLLRTKPNASWMRIDNIARCITELRSEVQKVEGWNTDMIKTPQSLVTL